MQTTPMQMGMIDVGNNSTPRCGNLIPGNGQNMIVNGGRIVGMHARIPGGVENMPNCGTIGTSGIEMMMEKAV